MMKSQFDGYTGVGYFLNSMEMYVVRSTSSPTGLDQVTIVRDAKTKRTPAIKHSETRDQRSKIQHKRVSLFGQRSLLILHDEQSKFPSSASAKQSADKHPSPCLAFDREAQRLDESSRAGRED